METGQVVGGRYRIGEKISLGGMACVWKATDTETGHHVAVKVIRPDQYNQGRLSENERLRQQTELLKRFEREGAFLEELDHPGIPRLLQRGYHRRDPYLVMEYVDGMALDDYLAKFRPLPLGVAVAIAVKVAEALSAAHAAQVIHRDLKPANILLAADGAVSLIDFGIALPARPDATRFTVLGATPGSVGYKAPEQIRGQQTVTTSVDQYSYGCVLFELLTGRQPFTDQPDRNRDMQHLEDPPPQVQDFKPSIPAELDELVRRLLEKDPTGRLTGMAEAIQILRPHLPAAGAPSPSPEVIPDPTARYRCPEVPIAPAAAPVRSAAGGRRSARWMKPRPDQKQFEDLLVRAEAERSADLPGPAVAALTELLDTARGAWGTSHLPVARAHLVCADAARLNGEWREAATLYRAVATALEHKATPAFRALALEARVGAAECRIPADDLQGAFDGWADVVHELAGLMQPPEQVVQRCREMALELEERGFGDGVRSFLRLLPEE